MRTCQLLFAFILFTSQLWLSLGRQTETASTGNIRFGEAYVRPPHSLWGRQTSATNSPISLLRADGVTLSADGIRSCVAVMPEYIDVLLVNVCPVNIEVQYGCMASNGTVEWTYAKLGVWDGDQGLANVAHLTSCIGAVVNGTTNTDAFLLGGVWADAAEVQAFAKLNAGSALNYSPCMLWRYDGFPRPIWNVCDLPLNVQYGCSNQYGSGRIIQPPSRSDPHANNEGTCAKYMPWVGAVFATSKSA